MGTIGERIKQLRLSQDMTQAELAAHINISRSNISRMEKDEINPSAINIVHICTYFNIYTDWLLTGEGEMLKKISPDTPQPLTSVLMMDGIELSIEEESIIDSYRNMTTEGKRKAQKDIKKIWAEHQVEKGALSDSDVECADEPFPYRGSDVG